MDSWILSIIGLVAAFCCMKPLFSEIVKAFFPVRFNLNWFVGCYIIYYLIHPLLNKAIERMNKKETKKLVKILFVVYLDVFFAVCKRYKVDYYHATEKQRAFIDAVAAHEFSMKQAHEKGLNRSSVPPFMGIKRSERSNNRPA